MCHMAGVIYCVSGVMCHMSGVMCQASGVTCQIKDKWHKCIFVKKYILFEVLFKCRSKLGGNGLFSNTSKLILLKAKYNLATFLVNELSEVNACTYRNSCIKCTFVFSSSVS